MSFADDKDFILDISPEGYKEAERKNSFKRFVLRKEQELIDECNSTSIFDKAFNFFNRNYREFILTTLVSLFFVSVMLKTSFYIDYSLLKSFVDTVAFMSLGAFFFFSFLILFQKNDFEFANLKIKDFVHNLVGKDVDLSNFNQQVLNKPIGCLNEMKLKDVKQLLIDIKVKKIEKLIDND